MQTFMARFVRPDGVQGVIYVLAASAGLALVDVLQREGALRSVQVKPRRTAALLTPLSWLPAPPTAKTDR